MICPHCGEYLIVFTNAHARKDGFEDRRAFFKEYGNKFTKTRPVVPTREESQFLKEHNTGYHKSSYNMIQAHGTKKRR